MYAFKCKKCGQTRETPDRLSAPLCCGQPMNRDYRAENIGVSFQGGGWARRK